MDGRRVLTDDEFRYLAARQRGRLVTLGTKDVPQIHPVRFDVDVAGWIEIGGSRLRDSQQYRNIRRDPRVTLMVDDDRSPIHGPDPQNTRGVEIRGVAVIAERATVSPGMSTDVIRIRPVRIDSWNVERPGHYSRFVT
jgi:pyridoxamine 5'-phosphate oxidase family protein